jgi:hypothetical protein
MSKTNSLLSLISLLVGAFVVVDFSAIANRRSNRASLVDAFNKIAIESPEASLECPIGLKCFESKSSWRIKEPPVVVGYTGNWVLHIVLESERVIGKGIRIVDGNSRPCDALQDDGDLGSLSNAKCF